MDIIPKQVQSIHHDIVNNYFDVVNPTRNRSINPHGWRQPNNDREQQLLLPP